jgi:predicted membrane channel-forming protein YqfA (hemolysin III family)
MGVQTVLQASVWSAVRVPLFLLFCIAAIGAFFLTVPPIPQSLPYHAFADQRPLLGIPHMLNVASNLPFCIVGIWGIFYMASAQSHRPGAFLLPAERWPYLVYFIGLLLTGIGSSYYHADPNNDRLVWDRAGLTIAFMGVFTAILTERLGRGFGGWLLGVLVSLGLASVFYWHWTEQHGAGDLRFYYVVQFFPLLALPVLLLCFAPRYTGTADLVAMLAAYLLAKVLELLDGQVYAQGGIVSGHTLKHLLGGVSAYLILHMLQHRRPIGQAVRAAETPAPQLGRL